MIPSRKKVFLLHQLFIKIARVRSCQNNALQPGPKESELEIFKA